MLFSVEYLNKKKSISKSAILITGLIFLYALLSDPFIFFIFVPSPIRMLVLLIPMVLVLYALTIKSELKYKAMVFIFLSIVLMYSLKNLDLSGTIIKYSVQFLFLISLFIYTKKTEINRKMLQAWFWFWIYVSLCVIFSFFIFKSNLMTFPPKFLSETSGNTDYYYSHIPLIGNFVNYSFLGFQVPKSSWYVFEPGMIAYFFGFNVLLSSYLSYYKVSSSNILIFKYVNMLGGFFTFSSTFILFLVGYVVYLSFRWLKSNTLKMIIIFLGVLLIYYAIYYVINGGLLEFTSFGNRSNRTLFGLKMISQSNIFDLLFGAGLGSPIEQYGAGLSSGLLSIFVEQGLVFLIFTLVIIFLMLRGKLDLFMFIIFYLLAFNPIYYPMTAIGLYLAYNTRNHILSDNYGGRSSDNYLGRLI